MPIEFRCQQCSKLLRTGDDTAGKSAKCPQCGNVMTIPARAAPVVFFVVFRVVVFVPRPAPPPIAPPAASPPPTARPAAPLFAPPALPASGFPAAPRTDSLNPYLSPIAGEALREFSTRQGAIVPTRISVADGLARTWIGCWPGWGASVGVILIGMLIGFALVIAYNAALFFAIKARSLPLLFLLYLGMIPLMGAVNIWLFAGQTKFFLNAARTGRGELGDMFKGGRYFRRVLGAWLMFSLMIFGALIAVGLPAAILAEKSPNLMMVGVIAIYGVIAMLILFYGEFLSLIVDQDVGVMDSFRLSRQITSGNRLQMIAIYVILYAVIVALFIAVAFLAYPLMMASPVKGFLIWMAVGALAGLTIMPFSMFGLKVTYLSMIGAYRQQP